MEASETRRAVAAARSIVAALGLAVDDAVVLHSSNKLSVRLLPCDVFARVAPAARQVAHFEVEVAQRLAETGSPVAALDPRVEPRVYEHDGFAVTLWAYYRPVTRQEISSIDYANALERLHVGMRTVDLTVSHFTDRIAEAQRIIASHEPTPEFRQTDHELLSNTLRELTAAINELGCVEQLLHGEPHPGNLVTSKSGPLFVDLETCCRGPVEFDLAHVPEDVTDYYPDVHQELLGVCRALVLAMVAAWRWEPGDRLPGGQVFARRLIDALQAGPPSPTLDVVWQGVRAQ